MNVSKIALVWPRGFDTHYVMPLAFAYIASNLDRGKYEIHLIDASLEDIGFDSPEMSDRLASIDPDVVGLSCWSPTFNEGLSVIKLAKSLNPDVVTVMGGAHAASYSDRVMQNPEIDYVFRGESELSFPVFLDQLNEEQPDMTKVLGLVYRGPGGKLLLNDMERADDVDVIHVPDYDFVNLDGYIDAGYRWNTPEKRNAPIWVTRGCPYRCTFCSAPMLNGRPIRVQSVEYMKNWVSKLYHEKGIRWFNIIDDNFTFNRKYAEEFCEAMIELGLPNLGFGTPNGIRLQKGSPELWRLMKKAGWRSLNVAPESGSQKTLEIMKKDLDLNIVPNVVRDIKEAGLKVQAYFILGYPGETIEDIELTTDLINKCKFNFVFLNNFQPLPGTPVYDDLVAQGEIEDGLMPMNYSDGSRTYTPDTLKDFNFPGFVLRTYITMILRDPFNFPYMLRIFGVGMIFTKVYKNFVSMLAFRRNTTSESI